MDINPWEGFAPSVTSQYAQQAPAQPAAPVQSAGAGRGYINPPQGQAPAQAQQAPAFNPWEGYAPSVQQSAQAPAQPPAQPAVRPELQAALDLANRPTLADLPGAVVKTGIDFLVSKATAIAGDAEGLAAQYAAPALNAATDYVGNKLGWSPDTINNLKVVTRDPMAIRDEFQQAGQDIMNFADKGFTPQQKAVANIPAPLMEVVGGATHLIGSTVGNAVPGGSPILGETASDLLNYKLLPKVAETGLPSDPAALVKATGQGARSVLTNPIWHDAQGNIVPGPELPSGARLPVKEALLKDANGDPLYYSNAMDAQGNRIPITSVYQSGKGMTTSNGPVGSYVTADGVTKPSVEVSPARVVAATLLVGGELSGQLSGALGLLTHAVSFAGLNELRGAIKENYKINKASTTNAGPVYSGVVQGATGAVNDENSTRND